MCEPDFAQELEDLVEGAVIEFFVRICLTQEFVLIHLRIDFARAAGEFHVDAQTGIEVLRDQKLGTIGCQFRLARPLVKRDHERVDTDLSHREKLEGDVGEEVCDCLVEDVSGFDVTEFMPQDSKQFLFIHQIDQTRVDDDEWAFHTRSKRVGNWVIDDVEIWLVHIENFASFAEQLVDRLALPRADVNSAAHKLNAHDALIAEFEKFAEDLVEKRNLFDCFQSGSVGWVLKGARGNSWKLDSS